MPYLLKITAKMMPPYRLSKLELLFGTLACCLFIIAYFFSFEVKQINGMRLRAEDFASALVLFPLLYLVIKKRILSRLHSKIFLSYSFIYIYSLLLTLIGLLLGRINFIGIVYAVRELQYVGVGLFFFLIIFGSNKKIGRYFNAIDRTIIFMVFINVAWAIYQVLFNDFRGHYGVAAIGLDGSSASSGASYFAGLVLVALMYARSKKKVLFVLIFLSILALMLTSNRTFILAAIIFLISWFLFFFGTTVLRLYVRPILRIKKKNLISFCLFCTILILIFLSLSFFKVRNIFFENITGQFGAYTRLLKLERAISIRYDLFLSEIEKTQIGSLPFYFGSGKGYYETAQGAVMIGMHSQFARLINEVGVIGLLMWVWFFGVLISFFSKSRALSTSESRVGISFILSFFSTFYSYDVFLIAKSAFLFWIFIFTALAYDSRGSSLNLYKNRSN